MSWTTAALHCIQGWGFDHTGCSPTHLLRSPWLPEPQFWAPRNIYKTSMYRCTHHKVVHLVHQCDWPRVPRLTFLFASVCEGVNGTDLHLNRWTLKYRVLPSVGGQRGHIEQKVRKKECAPFPSCLPAWVGTSHLTWFWLSGWDLNHCPPTPVSQAFQLGPHYITSFPGAPACRLWP